jgi:hypothetical protein
VDEQMSDASELGEKTERVLRKYGLDLCEHFLLDTARLESPAPRRVFASFTKNLSDGDPRGQFTLQQYEDGLERLFVKGLLCIVTPAEIEAESACNRQAGIPAVRRRNYYESDNVDFTQTGFDLNRNVSREIWGDDLRERAWSGWNVDLADRRVDVYGVTAEACQEVIDRHLQAFEKRERRYTIAQRPSPIGAWSPKRFIVLPSGFHGVLTYTVEPGPA